jgi:hypothetical protein
MKLSTPYEDKGFRRPPRKYAQLDLFAGRPDRFRQGARRNCRLEPGPQMNDSNLLGQMILNHLPGASPEHAGRTQRPPSKD